MLQICDYTLTQEIRGTNNIQHFLIVAPQEGQFEAVLSGVDRDRAGSCGPVEAVDRLAFDASEVYRVVQRANHTMVSAHDKRLSEGVKLRSWPTHP